ncbi:MAG: transposase [Petrimonas sp.]
MSLHLLPYADIIAWCLMPNHFHWMLWVREDVNPGAGSKPVPGLEKKWKSLNQSIGSLQSSYTQAINKQLNRSGSLFRKHCKSENLTDIGKISSSYYNTMFGTSLRVDVSEKEYPQVCFEYIHNNPVRAGLVNHPAEWEFSSYNDYYSGRTGKLVNRELAKEFVNL